MAIEAPNPGAAAPRPRSSPSAANGIDTRTLFVVIPFFNESRTLEECLRRIATTSLPDGWRRDVTLVDDGSHPDDRDAARRAVESVGGRFIGHERNRGKGAALRTAFADVLRRAGERDAILIQDADLEYDPGDYAALLSPIEDGDADVVFGNRWAGSGDAGGVRRAHRAMNRMLTSLSNALTGLRVHDMECCYKLFRASALTSMLPSLTEDRFGVEPQIAAAAARLRLKVAEAPVRYAPRSFAEGKKIRPKDGLRALWVILRERVRARDRGIGA